MVEKLNSWFGKDNTVKQTPHKHTGYMGDLSEEQKQVLSNIRTFA